MRDLTCWGRGLTAAIPGEILLSLLTSKLNYGIITPNITTQPKALMETSKLACVYYTLGWQRTWDSESQDSTSKPKILPEL